MPPLSSSFQRPNHLNCGFRAILADHGRLELLAAALVALVGRVLGRPGLVDEPLRPSSGLGAAGSMPRGRAAGRARERCGAGAGGSGSSSSQGGSERQAALRVVGVVGVVWARAAGQPPRRERAAAASRREGNARRRPWVPIDTSSGPLITRPRAGRLSGAERPCLSGSAARARTCSTSRSARGAEAAQRDPPLEAEARAARRAQPLGGVLAVHQPAPQPPLAIARGAVALAGARRSRAG